jgi:dipeptidyl aminopeptidase/acylaminoacyl peptidase
MANRGYVVWQVNLRGSSGYGRAFREASHGEFAGRMHLDLIDSLDALIVQGINDPSRVAIVGTSYGAYASLVGMTFTPYRFACGISVAAISDLSRLQDQAPPLLRNRTPCVAVLDWCLARSSAARTAIATLAHHPRR